ncbi:hypothetical protein CONLIGDRAFT_713155 [Coniochaeta ligniaria NRRL 30616]|uniref:Uncharacterized protein n=1 Tax=Coniochaeta ligniaria NRRL 30616 TaxID=1408157 RepID=A0A1J7JB70_9PEZI|nr:hypothetical protein CONLIGDRAFT_713155 [Coniochaeta ligniaria NRRL 30616]
MPTTKQENKPPMANSSKMGEFAKLTTEQPDNSTRTTDNQAATDKAATDKAATDEVADDSEAADDSKAADNDKTANVNKTAGDNNNNKAADNSNAAGNEKAADNDKTAEPMTAEPPKSKHRRVTGLKLKAKPASSDGLRRFALHNLAASGSEDAGSFFKASGLVSKELPRLYASNRLCEWRGFELERTPEAMRELEHDATPYETWDKFLTLVYEAMAEGPDGDLLEDRYLVFSKVTRTIMHGTIDPARKNGTIPKAARFTHFVPSNLLIIKIPIDCHSSAGYLDFIVKPIVGWTYAMCLGPELKLCGNTRYIAKIRESAVEGIDFDAPHPALEKIAATTPGIVDGFGSFNEADAGFRPFRTRPNKYDSPSVVVESSFGADYSVLRYKACWWLQLMAGEIKAVILVNVNPSAQEIIIEVWRNEQAAFSDNHDGPTRVQKLVITKKEQFKGQKEAANPGHYLVEGGPLGMYFDDFFLTAPDQHHPDYPQWDLCIEDDILAREAADLWYGDEDLVNDWVESPAVASSSGA